MKPVIFGCETTYLTAAEKAFFQKVNPLGFILFARNVQDKAQMRALTQDLKDCVGREDVPILIDQEGGRVQRMRAPLWTELPAAETYGITWQSDKEKALTDVVYHADVLAQELSEVGVNVDCWPCFDVAQEVTHPIMKNRCFSCHPDVVAALGNKAVETLLKKGIMPVVKHIPGYGRAQVDPHLNLPVVDVPLAELSATDFAPFMSVKSGVWGMTAHVIYTALDEKLPITLSKKGIEYIRSHLNFNGFLMCDDMMMKALGHFGSVDVLAALMLQAGCDAVLHCSGHLDEMEAVVSQMPELSEQSQVRLNQSKDLLWK